MLKKSHKILDVFVNNPTITYLFSEVKEYIKSKSESYTYSSLMYFVKEKILTKEKRGGLSFYKIANTPKAISFLSMTAEYKAWNYSNFPVNHIFDLVSKMNIDNFVLLVTGSYANKKQTKKSDLDVILIVPDKAKQVSSRLRHFCEMSIPEIHLYVFTNEEFKEMLLDKNHNYGKESVKNNLIFYGAEVYYRILFEVMENGFTY